MSKNCMTCVVNDRNGSDGLCIGCRSAIRLHQMFMNNSTLCEIDKNAIRAVLDDREEWMHRYCEVIVVKTPVIREDQEETREERALDALIVMGKRCNEEQVEQVIDRLEGLRLEKFKSAANLTKIKALNHEALMLSRQITGPLTNEQFGKIVDVLDEIENNLILVTEV